MGILVLSALNTDLPSTLNMARPIEGHRRKVSQKCPTLARRKLLDIEIAEERRGNLGHL